MQENKRKKRKTGKWKLPKKGVTQGDVAERVGLDRSTISKILNNNPDYLAAEETRAHVLKVAKEMGYNFEQLHDPVRRIMLETQSVDCKFRLFADVDSGTVVSGTGSLIGAKSESYMIKNLEIKRGMIPSGFFELEILIDGYPQALRAEIECVKYVELKAVFVASAVISQREKKKLADFIDKVEKTTRI